MGLIMPAGWWHCAEGLRMTARRGATGGGRVWIMTFHTVVAHMGAGADVALVPERLSVGVTLLTQGRRTGHGFMIASNGIEPGDGGYSDSIFDRVTDLAIDVLPIRFGNQWITRRYPGLGLELKFA